MLIIRAFVILTLSGIVAMDDLAAKQTQDLEKLHKQIANLAQAEIDESKTPSLQIAIGIGNEIFYEGAFGFADLERNVPASAKTKYRTASVAKWFTASATMKLAEQGRLALDKPIQTYCPEFPNRKWPITTRQLLSHTSGIRHYIDYDELIERANNDQDKERWKNKRLLASLDSFTRYTNVIKPLENFKDDPLVFKPGSDWEYSSFGYRALACVIQGATKSDFRSAMDKLIFNSVGMTNTTEDDAWEIISDRASGYRLSRSGSVRRADMRDVSANLPAGGYLSTASDMVKFALAFNSNLLSNESKNLMTSPVAVDQLNLDQAHSWRDAIPARDKYGYGLMLLSKYKNGMVGHSGRQAGGSAMLSLFPKQSVAISVMTNAKGWNGYLSFTMKLEALVEKYLAGELK